ncbi:MAG: hypothetical protein DWI48_00585 [Chloroflexi bacterium]|nr:MAG: hypothetical protein DWI48_00585 [Chloroflexota bacterium]
MTALRRRWRAALFAITALVVVTAQAATVIASEPAIRREAALRPAVEGYGEVRATAVPQPTAVAIVITEPGLRSPVPVTNIQTAQTSSGALTTITTAAPSGANARVEVPAGALPNGALVQLGAITDPTALIAASPPPESARVFAGFQLTATLAGGPRITDGFASPITLRLSLAAPPTGTTEPLQLAFWNGAEWVVQPATITRSANGTLEVIAQLDHFTLFAVLSQPEAPFAGAFPAPGSYDTPIWDGLTNTPVASAAHLRPDIRAIYAYDPASQTWRTYIEAAPNAASEQFTLRNGQLVIVLTLAPPLAITPV